MKSFASKVLCLRDGFLKRTASRSTPKNTLPAYAASLGLLFPLMQADQNGCSTEWISTPGGGQPAQGDSFEPVLSTDARFVAFTSYAANLVPGDTNQKGDVFVVDRQLHSIERVSVGTGDIEGNGESMSPDISGDGRFVVFVSKSSNWDIQDPHAGWDIYLRDRIAKTTELISVHVTPPAQSNGGSEKPRITPDGRFVVFDHSEDNLVVGDSNGHFDAFLRDRQVASTELISIDSAGVQGNDNSGYPVISADGRFVAFVSEASNWYSGYTSISGTAAFVYLRDRQLQKLTPVNADQTGKLWAGSSDWFLDISADGRYLLYLFNWKHADLTVMSQFRLFVRDQSTGLSEPIGYSVFGNGGTSGEPNQRWISISKDGRLVAFDSYYDEHVLHSSNVDGINVFVSDRITGLNQVAGIGPNGQWPSLPPQPGAEAWQSSIAPDGSAVAFITEDPSFGSGNAFYNVYVRSCNWREPQVYCESGTSSFGCRPAINFSGAPSASAGSGFMVEVQRFNGNTLGLFLYSTRRAILTPFQGSYLCMESPLHRTPVQATGGGPPSSCTGTLMVDFNAWIAGGADPKLVAGENVCVQAWTRDAGSSYGSNLSNAVAFVIGP